MRGCRILAPVVEAALDTVQLNEVEADCPHRIAREGRPIKSIGPELFDKPVGGTVDPYPPSRSPLAASPGKCAICHAVLNVSPA